MLLLKEVGVRNKKKRRENKTADNCMYTKIVAGFWVFFYFYTPSSFLCLYDILITKQILRQVDKKKNEKENNNWI